MLGTHKMALNVSRTDTEALCRQASRSAARLIRRLRLPKHEGDDLRQDLLADLIARLKNFDPTRGSLGEFASTVFAHRLSRAAIRFRRQRLDLARLSLSDPLIDRHGVTIGEMFAEADGYLAWIGSPDHPIAALDNHLSLDRALSCLSQEQLRLCEGLLTRPIECLCAERGLSRATLYRQLHDIRMRLLVAGIGQNSGAANLARPARAC